MEYIKCTKCGEVRPRCEFYDNERKKNGKFSQCISCSGKSAKMRKRTKYGCIRSMYDGQVYGAKRRNLNKPTYSFEWFYDWVVSQQIFHELYYLWAYSGYDTWEHPSIDRIDEHGQYTEDNIQIMTWRENHIKGVESAINGENNKNNIPILCYSKRGKFLREYHSTRAAGRDVGIPATNISACLHGKQDTAGGFMWKYKK